MKDLDSKPGALAANGPPFDAHMAMARAHLARKEWSIAEAAALRACALKPLDPAPLLILADIALLQGGRASEIEFLRGKLDGVEKRMPLRLRLADALVITGRETEALSVLDGVGVTGLGPEQKARWHRICARAHLGLGHLDRAEAEAQRARGLKPFDPAPLLILADVALLQGGRTREIEYLKDQLDGAGNCIPLLMRLADALVIAGRGMEALCVLDEPGFAGLVSGQKARWHRICARAHLGLGHLERAEAEAQRARAIDPGDPAPVLLQGQVTLLRDGRARQAEFLARNLEGLSDSFAVRIQIATLYLSERRHAEALTILQALELSVLNDEKRLKLAGFLAGLGRPDLAEAAYRQVNRKGPMGDGILLYEALNGAISPSEALKVHDALGLKSTIFHDALLALALKSDEGAVLLDAGPGSPLGGRLDKIRLSAGHLADLQRGYEAADTYRRPSDTAWRQLPLVSIICPVHRAEDVANLVDQLLRQDYPRIEAVVVINGPQIDAAWMRERLLDSGRFAQVRILEYPEDTTLGRCLNLGVTESTGDYLARFDADDRYLESYLSRTMNFMLSHSAAICGRFGLLFLFESMGFVALRECRDVAAYAVVTDAFLFPGGSTIVLRRDAALRLPYDEALTLGEDMDFYVRAYGSGFKTVYAPPFDHIVMRKADLARHTWQQQDINLLLNFKSRLTAAADAAALERWLGAL